MYLDKLISFLIYSIGDLYCTHPKWTELAQSTFKLDSLHCHFSFSFTHISCWRLSNTHSMLLCDKTTKQAEVAQMELEHSVREMIHSLAASTFKNSCWIIIIYFSALLKAEGWHKQITEFRKKLWSTVYLT